MEIGAFVVGMLMFGVGSVIVVLLLIYFIISRIRERNNEDFEKRNN